MHIQIDLAYELSSFLVLGIDRQQNISKDRAISLMFRAMFLTLNLG